MDQNTPEWILWRKKGISASDSPIILGLSEYSTPRKLCRVKRGEAVDEFESRAAWRGHVLESRARDWAIFHLGVELIPWTWEWLENRLFRASFDGIDWTQRINVEIKCLSETNHTAIRDSKEIPLKYRVQMEHQAMVGELKRNVFISYFEDANGNEKDRFVMDYSPDSGLRKRIISEGLTFWEHVTNGTEPGATDMDVITVSDPSLIAKLQHFKSLKSGTKAHSGLKSELQSLFPHPRIRFGDTSVTLSKNGSIRFYHDKEQQ